MQENLYSKPFILALHEDHALALRELCDEEMQHVAGGDACMETVIFTPDCTEGIEFDCE
jgi:hypothetical protein